MRFAWTDHRSRTLVVCFALAVAVVCLWIAGCAGPTPAPVSGAGPAPSAGPAASGGLRPGEYPQPNVSKLTFAPVAFPGAADQYKSQWVYNAVSVKVAREGDGLRCDIVAPPASEKGIYGGVTMPVPGLKAFRMEITFVNPAGIAVLFVDGYTGIRNKPAVRWEWRNMPGREFTTSAQSCVLVPGAKSRWFNATTGTKSDAAGVKRVDVFCRAKPGAKAGFIVRNVEVAK